MARVERVSPIAKGAKNIMPLWPTLLAKITRASGESIQLSAKLEDVRCDRAILGSCSETFFYQPNVGSLDR